MRIALAGVWHETNSYVPGRTGLDDFRNFQLHAGDALLREYTGGGTELAGAIAAAAELSVEVVPLLYAAAVPGGLVARDAYDSLREDLLSRVAAAGPLDAIVLVLHGAMAAEGVDSPEVELMGALRAERPDVPVAATLDLHANLDDALARECLLLCGYDTYPHIDMADRGSEVLRLAARALREGPPDSAHVKLPLLTVPQVQETASPPMAEVYAALAALERRPDVWTASVLPGYPYTDVERLGMSVYVAADGDAAAAAEELAALAWERRASFVPELTRPEDAVAGIGDGPGPVVLADVADNVGGGSPGNGLTLLRLLVERGGRDAAVVIWDPDAAVAAHADPTPHDALELRGFDTGGPAALELRGRVAPLGNVAYRRPGPYMRGQRVDMGRVALVECAAGLVVVTEHRVMPFDDAHLRVVGVEPERLQALVVKGAVAWKAGFGAIAARACYVSTPGYCPSDLAPLNLRIADRAFPLRPDATRDAAPTAR